MPTPTRVPCSGKGGRCTALIPPNTGGKCHDCQLRHWKDQNKARRLDPRLKDNDDFYKSRAWKAFAAWWLRMNPCCAKCGAPGRYCDHVIARRMGGADFDPDNSQTLCVVCDARKRQAEGQAYRTKGKPRR